MSSSTEQLTGARLQLELPPSAEHVSTARLFAASVSRQLVVDEDTVADIKVAISEACTGAIDAQNRAGSSEPIVVALTPSENRLVVEVESVNGEVPPTEERWNPATPTESFQSALGTSLIRALFPDAEYLPRPTGGLTIRFSVSLL